jgi:hypothetical protein
MPPVSVVDGFSHRNRNPIRGGKSIFTTICQLGFGTAVPFGATLMQVTVAVAYEASVGLLVVK